MDRMACVDLPDFPLQLLLRRHPDWRIRPAVVVDCDKPQGQILWANERARSFRVLPGMRYAAALALAGDLRASVVPTNEIERAVVFVDPGAWYASRPASNLQRTSPAPSGSTRRDWRGCTTRCRAGARESVPT